jgi:hypothetical protein
MPIDMDRPMRIPPDGGLSMGTPPPTPPAPPPGAGGGERIEIVKAPSGEFMVMDGDAPMPVGDLGGLMDFLQSRFGEQAPAPAGPPLPPEMA